MIPNQAVLLQAVRGPLLLITLGILFELQQLEIVSFTRSWPALLIVYGLLKLGERMGDHPVYPPTFPPGELR